MFGNLNGFVLLGRLFWGGNSFAREAVLFCFVDLIVLLGELFGVGNSFGREIFWGKKLFPFVDNII